MLDLVVLGWVVLGRAQPECVSRLCALSCTENVTVLKKTEFIF